MATLEEQTGGSAGTCRFRTGFSDVSATDRAIDELLDRLDADTAALTLVFFSPEHDAEVVSDHLDRRTGARGIAGTTAGELSNEGGFTHGAMSGVSLHGPGVRATAEVIPNLDELSLVPVEQLPEQYAGRLGLEAEELSPDRHLWLLLVDGFTGAEDLLTSFFVRQAPPTQLVGGSLGEESASEGARVVFHGRRYRNAAALVLLEYDGPFEIFNHHHLDFLDATLEVTSVSDGGRVIDRLDGKPAAEAYAAALGRSPDDLDPRTIATHPLGFRFRGRPLVCSIAERLDRGQLRVAKTVHPGDTLHLLEARNLVGSTRDQLAETLEQFRDRHGTDATGGLFFHCLGRYQEACADESVAELAAALDQLPYAGLNTYGEQYQAMHTNHTLTGALFG